MKIQKRKDANDFLEVGFNGRGKTAGWVFLFLFGIEKWSRTGLIYPTPPSVSFMHLREVS